MAKVRILEVTQEDINEALSFTPHDHALEKVCPIARALKRTFAEEYGEHLYVRAHPDYIQVGRDSFDPRVSPNIFKATDTMRRFMHRYDTRRKATPTRFKLMPY